MSVLLLYVTEWIKTWGNTRGVAPARNPIVRIVLPIFGPKISGPAMHVWQVNNTREWPYIFCK